MKTMLICLFMLISGIAIADEPTYEWDASGCILIIDSNGNNLSGWNVCVTDGINIGLHSPEIECENSIMIEHGATVIFVNLTSLIDNCDNAVSDEFISFDSIKSRYLN